MWLVKLMNRHSAPPSPHSLRRLTLAASSLLLLATSGFAVPLHYEVASGSVIANGAEPGLVIGTMVEPTVPGTSFSLDNGASFTFDFFDIWTDEPKINADDLAPYPIFATLNFSDPFTGATVSGITVGGRWMSGLSQWGTLTWDGPITIALNDRAFQISLSNAEFNYGFGGLNEGMMCGADVTATITQLTSQINVAQPPTQPTPIPTPNPTPNPTPAPQPVPEGGQTALLLGVALVSLGLLACIRRSVQNSPTKFYVPVATSENRRERR
jgi:hypothetical protein